MPDYASLDGQRAFVEGSPRTRVERPVPSPVRRPRRRSLVGKLNTTFNMAASREKHVRARVKRIPGAKIVNLICGGRKDEETARNRLNKEIINDGSLRRSG